MMPNHIVKRNSFVGIRFDSGDMAEVVRAVIPKGGNFHAVFR